MASTLVRGKYVLCKITDSNSAEVISDGAVFQQNGEIMDVGRYDDLKERYNPDEIIGSPSYVVMPGLVDSHFHVGVTPFQLGAPDLPLELWLFDRMGSKEVDLYLAHLYAATQMLKSGTTTMSALTSSFMPIKPDEIEKILKAARVSGIRISYGTLISNQNRLVAGPEGGDEELASQLPASLATRFKSYMVPSYLSTEEHVSNVEEVLARYADNSYERIRVTVAPSNVHRCSDELLIALKELAGKYNVGIHIHLQETVYQKLYGLHAWGKSPLQHLNDLGFLGPDVTCAHSIWVTDSDIEVMASTGTNVCHLASSNLRLQSGIAPVNYFLKKGIKVAMGSDEANINDDRDLLQEMRLVLKLHRLPGIENIPPTTYQVFQMATVNGAHISGFGDRIGTLEIGKRADIVLLNLRNIEEPYLDPDVSIVDAVIHRGRGIDVETVMVDGEVVLRDGQLTRVDIESLYKELKDSLTRPSSLQETERSEFSEQLEPYLHRFYEKTIGRLSQPHYHYNARD
jgi:cytosine/adenosine deaminase-related metal-dependent hydrolase